MDSLPEETLWYLRGCLLAAGRLLSLLPTLLGVRLTQALLFALPGSMGLDPTRE